MDIYIGVHLSGHIIILLHFGLKKIAILHGLKSHFYSPGFVWFLCVYLITYFFKIFMDLILFLFASAGLGRTGCYIAISIGMRQLDEEHMTDILGIVCQLRQDR